MKLSTFILAIVFIIGLWGLFPSLFILLNHSLGLPILNNLFFKFIGIFLLVLALGVDLYLFWFFSKVGHGTPIPIEPTQKIITTGLYTKSRNPMYISHLIFALGLFFLLGHVLLLPAVLCEFVLLHLFLVYWEEPNLKKRLGPTYLTYLRQIPRWV